MTVLEPTPVTILINAENMKNLYDLYGDMTDACRNRVINDLIKDEVVRCKKHTLKEYRTQKPLQLEAEHTEIKMYDKCKNALTQ